MNANFQYIIIAVMFLLSCYSVFRIFRKNFSSQKFEQKKTYCDKDCGCS